MSSKKCPRAPLGRYKAGTSFSGPIISLLSSERGLFYTLDQNLFEKFQEFENYLPVLDCNEPPEYGEIFLFLNEQQKCYRAYRLNSNTAIPQVIRAFLFDVGWEIYTKFKKGSFFKMPYEFLKTQPMAILCYAESFPSNDDDHHLKSEFLNESIYMSFQYIVLRRMEVEDNRGKHKKCLVVAVMEQEKEEEDSNTKKPLKNGMMEPISVEEDYNKFWPNKAIATDEILTYIDDNTDHYIGFKVKDISLESKLPEPGSKILIYPINILGSNSLYALIMNGEDFTNKLSSDAMSLNIRMNLRENVERYQKLQTKPEVGDMVLACGSDDNIYRGTVADNAIEFFPIFLIDCGQTSRINFRDLYKFPKEFCELPAQAAHLSVANVKSCDDPLKRLEPIAVIENMLMPFGIAHVISSHYDGFKMCLSVNLFDEDGNDIAEYLQLFQ